MAITERANSVANSSAARMCILASLLLVLSSAALPFESVFTTTAPAPVDEVIPVACRRGPGYCYSCAVYGNFIPRRSRVSKNQEQETTWKSWSPSLQTFIR